MTDERRAVALRRSAIAAALALAAVSASFCTVDAICRIFDRGSQPAIVAALIAMSLAQRLRRPAAELRARDALLIAGLAPVCLLVGWLLVAYPLVGAVAFIAAMSGSIALRNFGERGRRAGTLIALPLVAMLVVPAPAPVADTAEAWLATVVFAAASGLVAFGYAMLADAVGLRLRVGAAAPPAPVLVRAGVSGARPSAHTRMASQMAVALSAALVLGFGIFRDHWGWSVFTAYIVSSGARGRGDAVYKGVLRLVGAVGGTLAAAALGAAWSPRDGWEAAAIFVTLYVGLLLRERSYAYWAGCMTLILALLAGSGGGGTLAVLGLRLAAIVVGALCAVGAAWFVMPIRSEAVVRRRLADALLALDEIIAHPRADDIIAHRGVDAAHSARFAVFEHCLGELNSVAPPLEWHRRLFAGPQNAEHPAGWIDVARELLGHARTLVPGAPAHERARIRRAIGLTRRAVALHGKPDAPAGPSIAASLADLRQAFTEHQR